MDIYNLTYDNLTCNDTEFLNSSEFNLSFIAISQILYSIIFIIGLLANSWVIYVVLRFAEMQTVTNIYVVNLAMADMCLLIGIPFSVTTISLRGWIFGNTMCEMYMVTTSISQFTSIISLLVISGDRYMAVCHPISSQKMRTPFNSKIISLSAWVTSALFILIPIFLYANTMEYTNGIVSCNIYWPNGGHTFITFYMLIFSFIIPLIFILVFYLLMIKELRTYRTKSKKKEQSYRKNFRLVLTLIIVYVFCWLPYWVIQVASIYIPLKQCQNYYIIISFLTTSFLSYTNSTINPFVYAFLNDNFKKRFPKACNCAAGKDINATVNNENSVFARRKINDDRLQADKMIVAGSSRMDFDEETNTELLSKTYTTTIMMTSRSNIEIRVSRDPTQKDKDLNKNGAQLTLSTQV